MKNLLFVKLNSFPEMKQHSCLNLLWDLAFTLFVNQYFKRHITYARGLFSPMRETIYLFFLPVGEKMGAVFVEVQSVLNQDYHQVGKGAEKKYTAYQSLPLFSDLTVPELLQKSPNWHLLLSLITLVFRMAARVILPKEKLDCISYFHPNPAIVSFFNLSKCQSSSNTLEIPD